MPSPRAIQMTVRPRSAAVFVRPGCDQLFFVYTGRSRGVGVDPMAFFTRTRLLERNVVIFQDRYQAFYQRGISSTIDSFDALLRWQIDFRASLPHVRRVFCLGASLGGYAALLAGHRLAVERVWAFGPITALSDEVLPRGLAASCQRDLSVALDDDNGTTIYDVFYNEREGTDEAAARRLAGCQRVRLWPQPGDGHNVVRTLMDLGKLEDLLPSPS